MKLFLYYFTVFWAFFYGFWLCFLSVLTLKHSELITYSFLDKKSLFLIPAGNDFDI